MLVLASFFIIAILIAVNGLFVAAEFGAVAVRRTRVQELAEKGSRLAPRLLSIISAPATLDRYIAACQVGITVSSLLLGAYGQMALAPQLAPLVESLSGWAPLSALSVSAVVVLIALTSAQMVLGELLPKAIALRYPEGTALYTTVPVAGSLKLMAPLIVILNGSGLLILRLLGIRHAAEHTAPTIEELEDALKETGAGGTLAPEQIRRLRSALRLGNRTARSVMVPRDRVVALSVDTPPDEVLKVVLESPYTRFPVYRERLDRVVGVLHTKDVAMRLDENGTLPPLSKLMRRPTTVPATTPADRLLVLLREARAPMAIVMDEDAQVVGLVTLDDLLVDLFGELADEFKTRPARKATPLPEAVS